MWLVIIDARRNSTCCYCIMYSSCCSHFTSHRTLQSVWHTHLARIWPQVCVSSCVHFLEIRGPYQLKTLNPWLKGVNKNVTATLSHNLSYMFLFFFFILLVHVHGFDSFILHSSDDSMTWPDPVLSLLLWPYMCLCCTVWLQCTSLFLCNIDTRINQSNLHDRDVLIFYFVSDYICFFCFASQEYISFRDFFLFVGLFSVLKQGLVSTSHSSPWMLTPCILLTLRLSQC